MVYNRWLKKYESLCKERRGIRKSQGKKQGNKRHLKYEIKLRRKKMPFVSQQQRKWAYTKEGTKALGGKNAVQEWEKATKGKLPKYAKKR